MVNNYTNIRDRGVAFEAYYYNNKSNKINYSGGIQSSFNSSNNIYDQANLAKLKELDVYPYISLASQIRSDLMLMFNNGLSVVNTYSNGNKNWNWNDHTSLTLSFDINKKWNILLESQFNSSTPPLSSLTDIDQREDSLMVNRGNPYLKSSNNLSNRLILSYKITQKININLNAFHFLSFKPLTPYYYFDSSIKSFISQIQNQKRSIDFGISPQIQFNSIFKIFDVTLYSVYEKYESEGKDYKREFGTFGWGINIQAQLFKNCYANFTYTKAPFSLKGEVKSKAYGSDTPSLGIIYNYKNLSFSLLGDYLLSKGDKYDNKNMSKIIPSETSTIIKDDANLIRIRVSYYFNWGKSLFNIKKHLSNSAIKQSGMSINDAKM